MVLYAYSISRIFYILTLSIFHCGNLRNFWLQRIFLGLVLLVESLHAVSQIRETDGGALQLPCQKRTEDVSLGLNATYWCLIGNGWEWGVAGFAVDTFGSFPHSLLSTNKLKVFTCP